jgi:RNA polymerase sigma-B factor
MSEDSIKRTGTLPANADEAVADYGFLVQRIAYGLARRTADPVEDLIQVGMIGLLESFKRYDPTQAASFKTYATHFITGHIRHYLRDRQQLLKGPRALQELAYRLSNIEKRLQQELNRDPSLVEIAAALDVTLESAEEARTFERRARMVWLDQEMNDDGQEKRTLLDSLSSDDGGVQNRMDTRLYLLEGLERLEPLDRDLLKLRYFEDLTQAVIAEQMDMSQMEVCRKIKQAEKRLRKLLYDFVD